MAIMTEQQPVQVDTMAPEINTAQTQATKPKVPQTVPQNNPVPLEQLDKDAAFIECPFCLVRGRTTVTFTSTDATGCMALGCCCVLGILGVWMPFVFHWGADIDHHCSTCKRLIVHKDHNGVVQVHRPAVAAEKEAPPPQYVPMPGMEKAQVREEGPVVPNLVQPAPIQPTPVAQNPVLSTPILPAAI